MQDLNNLRTKIKSNLKSMKKISKIINYINAISQINTDQIKDIKDVELILLEKIPWKGKVIIVLLKNKINETFRKKLATGLFFYLLYF